MSAALDMTLDDIIKNNKKSGSGNPRGGRSRPGPASGPGPARRIPNRAGNRAAPYSAAKVTNLLPSIVRFFLQFVWCLIRNPNF